VSIKTSLYTFLTGTSSITDTLSTTTSVWPAHLPQNHSGFPALTFSMDDDRDDHALDGVIDLKYARFNIDCWAGTYLEADQVATAVKAALVDYRGSFGADTAEHIRKEREIDLFEEDTDLHRVNLQFLIAYS